MLTTAELSAFQYFFFVKINFKLEKKKTHILKSKTNILILQTLIFVFLEKKHNIFDKIQNN